MPMVYKNRRPHPAVDENGIRNMGQWLMANGEWLIKNYCSLFTVLCSLHECLENG